MASLFRPHRRSPEPDLASDKSLRSRPPAPLTASPSQSAPPPPQPRNPSWISGVLAEAGKFISSVFVSDDSSSEYSSDGDTISISSEDEDTDTSAPELREPYVAFKSELTSPVDIAKSYMRSLPLRHSPSLCSSGFRTLQPSGTLLYKDGTYVPTNNYFPSSKVLKRKYLDPEPWNIHDDLRRVCIKSKDNLLVTTSDEQVDHSMSLSETEAFTISSATEERKLNAENHFVNGALSLPDEKAIEVNCYVETGNAPPISITSKLDKVLNAGQPTNESPMPTIPLPSHSEFGIEFSHNEDHIFDKIKDVEGPLQIKDGGSSFPLPNGSLVLPNPLMDHDVSRHPNRDAELPEVVHDSVHDSEDALAEYTTDTHLATASKGGPNPTNSNNNEPDVLNPREAYELISEAAVKLPNGTRMKSMERILAETKPMVQPWKRRGRGSRRAPGKV